MPISKLTACLSFAVVLGACTSPPDAPSRDWGPLPDDAVFEETVVELGDGMGRVVSSQPLTVGEARRQNQARELRAADPTGPASAVQDFSCRSSAYWLYDRVDGTGNRICFLGAGTALLATYPRWDGPYYGNWAIGFGTSWPGNRSGRLVRYGGELDPENERDANFNDPEPVVLQQFDFSAWGGPTNFYGLVEYDHLILE